MTETEDLFEGHEPRECGEHRTLGSHRAWCFDCHEYCYPRIAAACNGCRNPVIEQLLDDLAAVLGNLFHNGRYVTTLNGEPHEFIVQHPDVVAVLARYQAYKETE
jgi:hypothetical protein